MVGTEIVNMGLHHLEYPESLSPVHNSLERSKSKRTCATLHKCRLPSDYSFCGSPVTSCPIFTSFNQRLSA